MSIKKKKICIIGTGKAGSAFAIELCNAGAKVSFLIDKNIKVLRTLSKSIKDCKTNTRIESSFIEASDIIIIAVKDPEIKKVSEELFKLDVSFKNKIIFHISGSLTSQEISDRKINKNNIASVHPIQTFNKISTKNEQLLNGIYFGVEGGKNALKIAGDLIKLLGSKYIVIPASKKYIYHIASIFASNYLVVISDIIAELTGSILSKKVSNTNIFLPIIKNTLSNIEKNGIEASLTGPIDRNDLVLIEKHIKDLKKNKKNILPLYSLLGKAAAEIAARKGSINNPEKIKLRKLFERSLPSLKSNSRN